VNGALEAAVMSAQEREQSETHDAATWKEAHDKAATELHAAGIQAIMDQENLIPTLHPYTNGMHRRSQTRKMEPISRKNSRERGR